MQPEKMIHHHPAPAPFLVMMAFDGGSMAHAELPVHAGRKPISKKIRFEVFKRDGFICQYCGATPPKVILHVDHIVPVAEGGKNNIDNLVAACEPCNLGKGARLLTAVPKSLKDKAAEIKEREEQLRGYNAILEAKARRIENDAWDIATAISGEAWLEKCDARELLSIKRFLDLLPKAELMAAAELTSAKFQNKSSGSFRYFCAVCWNKLREPQ